MSHKEGGLVSVVVGLGMIGATWYLALREGKYYDALCIIGPAAMIFGLAMLFLPPEKLFQCKEEIENGVAKITYDTKKLTILGWKISLSGAGLGVIQVIIFHFGWI